MVLNFIWLFFFFAAFIMALFTAFFQGEWGTFEKIVTAIFKMSKTGFEISIGLTGLLAFWLGLMKVGEKAGLVHFFARILNPFFRGLFPKVPSGHPAFGYLTMNLVANMLGLDNAATPVGLKAMKELQGLNKEKSVASDAQILFLVLNTSGLTLIPISIMAYRLQMGASDPADIFLPILLSTFFSTVVGLIAVALYQKINLFKKEVIFPLGGLTAFIFTSLHFLSQLPREQMKSISQNFSYALLLSLIVLFLFWGWRKKRNVYEDFIEGAKEGFQVAVQVIPYLIAVLAAIAAFRASGGMELVTSLVAQGLNWLSLPSNGIEALPVALMKPLSGSGARGLMVEVMQTHGPDAFVSRLAATFQGATDTTFYILAVYFGSVGIRRARHAVTCGLLADFAGVIAAVVICYWFF